MHFYEILQRGSMFDSKTVVYRTDSLELASKKLDESYDKVRWPQGLGEFTIMEVLYQVENNRIARFERQIFGYRKNGPLFENLNNIGYFDYRGEKLNDDQRAVLDIQLRATGLEFVS